MHNLLLVYYEPAQSGQTAHVFSLARGLDPANYRLQVIVPAHLQAAVTQFREAGVQVHPMPLRKLFWPMVTCLAFIRLIRQENFDLVHVHSQEAGVMARLLAYLAGARRIIYTPQTIDIRQVKWRWLYVIIERMLARITHTIVAVNQVDRVRMLAWGIPADRVVCIPNGVDLSLFAQTGNLAELRQQLSFDIDAPLVMQVGRLGPQKDPQAFVTGACRVLEKVPTARFALVGDGPLRADLTADIQALGLETNIQLLGWQADAYKLMRAASVVSLTSRWEGTPFSLLEAMSWALPVVATNVNGCAELVINGITGYLVPPGDPDAWAARVIDLLQDVALAKKLGAQGRRHVEAHYSLQEMIAQIERLYLAIMSG
jgi:glycosyltransferase involved in cell wall biosynthesis